MATIFKLDVESFVDSEVFKEVTAKVAQHLPVLTLSFNRARKAAKAINDESKNQQQMITAKCEQIGRGDFKTFLDSCTELR